MKKRIFVIVILIIMLISLSVTATGSCNHNYVFDHSWTVGYVDGGATCERWLGIALKCTYCGDIHYTQDVQYIPHDDALTVSYLTDNLYLTEFYCGRYFVSEYECSNCGHYHSESYLYSSQEHNVAEWHIGGYSATEGGYLFYGDCTLCGTTICYYE